MPDCVSIPHAALRLVPGLGVEPRVNRLSGDALTAWTSWYWGDMGELEPPPLLSQSSVLATYTYVTV